MTKDEALDLALEALENSVDLVREDAYNAEKLYGNYPSRQGKVGGLKVLADDHEKAITAIKQARALDKKAENARELGLDYEPVLEPDYWPGTKPVQEPVAMRMPKVGDKVVCIEDESLGTVVYLTAGGSPEIKFDDGSHGTYMLREFAELFGYTTPPAAQRQWVGLTNDEVNEFAAGCHLGNSVQGAIYKAEAKLKEKNT